MEGCLSSAKRARLESDACESTRGFKSLTFRQEDDMGFLGKLDEFEKRDLGITRDSSFGHLDAFERRDLGVDKCVCPRCERERDDKKKIPE
jgi:hypothetical protein